MENKKMETTTKVLLSKKEITKRHKIFCKAFELNVGDIIYIYGWVFYYIGDEHFCLFDIRNKTKRNCKYPPYEMIINRGFKKMTYENQVENMTRINDLTDYEMQMFLHKKGIVLYDEKKDNNVDNEILAKYATEFGFVWEEEKSIWTKKENVV